MKRSTELIIDKLFIRYSDLTSCPIKDSIEVIVACYKNGKKLLVCGNGGSAADSLHIVGELMKGFVLPRKLEDVKQKEIRNLFPETAQ